MRGLNQQAIPEKSKTTPEKTGAGNRFVQKIGRAVPNSSKHAPSRRAPKKFHHTLYARDGVWGRAAALPYQIGGNSRMNSATVPRQRWLRIIPPALIMYTISYVDRTNVS